MDQHRTVTRPAGHVLVEALIEQGITDVFGVPGESYLAVLDGFHEHRERIRFVACRQEGGAAFMAEAQGKLTGRPGICFVTRGPGATNASIGLHTAFQDSTPMILFIGQVASDQRDREAFQEVDYRQMLGPGTLGMAKWVGEVQDPARLPEYVARAFHTAMQGRPGPVVLVLPEDMLTQPTDAPVLPRAKPAVAWPAPADLVELQARFAGYTPPAGDEPESPRPAAAASPPSRVVVSSQPSQTAASSTGPAQKVVTPDELAEVVVDVTELRAEVARLKDQVSALASKLESLMS